MPINIGGSILLSGAVAPSGSVQRPVLLNGSTAALAAPSPGYLYRNGISTNGMYYMNPGNLGVNQFYIDFTTYPGKPMTMVLSNRQGSNGMPSLSYANATNAVVTTTGTYDANLNFNVWVGLNYWRYLGNWVVQGVKGYQQTYNSTQNVGMGSMDRAGKFKFAGWTGTYAFQWGTSWTQITGSGQSGLYNYHVANGYSLTTFDNDQDTAGNNCSLQYGNNPWWYGACWSGSYYGAGSSSTGHQNAPYWVDSGTEWYAYGAIYMCYDTATLDS